FVLFTGLSSDTREYSPDSPHELYEIHFAFASIQPFSGVLFQDQLIDHHMEFSR
ncbi:unnamed protein product, partial [Eretmochelys imbricata]